MSNFIDNAIAYLSPETGAKREAWRQSLNEMRRSYDAGNQGRLNAGWVAYNQSAEHTDRYHRDTIRARARDLERNSDMANSVIGAYKRNIVGQGRTLQARTGDENLDNLIEESWKEWCKRKNCDITETQNFNQMLRMAVQRKKVDGGILFKKCYTHGGMLPFKLQALEVDELDTGRSAPRNKDCRVCGGIEFNGYNKIVGFWVKQYTLDGFGISDPVYVPEKDMIFLYTKLRPSQVREISDLAPTISRIRDANEFMTAVSVKERIAACLSVFIKKVLPTVNNGPGRNLPQTQNGIASYEGKTISPGMIKELNAGDEIQVVNPTGQARDAASFIKLQQRLVGAGQGLSYEATSRDMSQSNYSSARQGSIEDGLTYAEDAELLEEVFLDEVYETFVMSGVLAGLFNIPNFWNKRQRYFKHEWVAAPKKWIDPLKEAHAGKIALQTGQKTFQQIAAENGKDWKEQIDEMCAVLEYAKEKGIDLGGVIFGKDANLYQQGEVVNAGDPDDEAKPKSGEKPDEPENV